MKAYFRDIERSLFEGFPGFELNRDSIPLKRLPWGARALDPGQSGVNGVTPREATALLIAVKASDARPIRGGAAIPRRFRLGGADWVIENGCGQDIIHSRAAGLIAGTSPLDDVFVLTNIFVEEFLGLVAVPQIAAFLAADRPSRLDD